MKLPKKATLILILSIIWINSFSQSKKKQIEHLKYQVDSIQEIFLKEKKESSKQILDLNESVKNLRSEITNLEINLENGRLDIDKNKITIIEQKRKIENLELTVQYLEDSLRNVQIKLQLQLLENSEQNLSDLELKELMVSRINDLYPNLINETNSKSEITILGSQLFELKGEKQIIIVIGVANEDECHYCTGLNFIGHLQIVENKWQVKSVENCSRENQWGKYALLDNICSAGTASIAIIISELLSTQGVDEGQRIVYLFRNNMFIPVYQGLSHYNNQGEVGLNDPEYENISYEINFIENGKNFFDIKETRINHGRIVSYKVYQFNEISLQYEPI